MERGQRVALDELLASCWTVTDLARAAGVHTSTVRHLLLKGRLQGWKAGRQWLVFDDSARAWLASPRKPGRPPKGARLAGRQLALDEDQT